MKQINNRTKIIATIGPSSSEYNTLKEMIKSDKILIHTEVANVMLVHRIPLGSESDDV